jgi:CubicO group peptidase (beta-lactamase class C family)
MSAGDLQDFVSEAAAALDVPGVAVGLLHQGEAAYAFHGVTSVENPLPVDEVTLFQFGSTGKTFTSTALLRLVEQGHFDLDTRVRDVLPELTLKDESVAERVTLLQLTNHTAGWSGDVFTSTGDGDDALERYVAALADVDQVTPLGESVSYNNAALSVAGRVIEKVTALTFEQAIRELIFQPLGMEHSFFFPNEVMTRRFAVGHNQGPDGTITVARPWAMPRNAAPAGGISANAADQIAWARFHLGDGTAPDGTRLLSTELLKRMQEPTVDMPGAALGDHVGISWLLRDLDDGIRTVGHGGTTNGQHSDFLMVPARDFAVISMTNCGPNGPMFNEQLTTWALQTHLGITVTDPEPVLLGDAALEQYTGHYETAAVEIDITAGGGQLSIQIGYKPEAVKVLREEGTDPSELQQPPIVIGMLPGDGDRFVVAEGPAKGMKGYFARDADGRVSGAHIGGRMASRVPANA